MQNPEVLIVEKNGIGQSIQDAAVGLGKRGAHDGSPRGSLKPFFLLRLFGMQVALPKWLLSRWATGMGCSRMKSVPSIPTSA